MTGLDSVVEATLTAGVRRMPGLVRQFRPHYFVTTERTANQLGLLCMGSAGA